MQLVLPVSLAGLISAPRFVVIVCLSSTTLSFNHISRSPSSEVLAWVIKPLRTFSRSSSFKCGFRRASLDSGPSFFFLRIGPSMGSLCVKYYGVFTQALFAVLFVRYSVCLPKCECIIEARCSGWKLSFFSFSLHQPVLQQRQNVLTSIQKNIKYCQNKI